MSNDNNNKSEELENSNDMPNGHKKHQEAGFFDSLLSGIDTSFPLSGAEPDIPIIEIDEPLEEEKQSQLDNFLQSLDTSFPLSGGEPNIEFIEFEAPEIDLSIDDEQKDNRNNDNSFPLSGG